MSTDLPLAARLVARLVAARATLATAESLTGGLLGGEVTDVAGASAAYRGGVVSYATDLKVDLLGVPADVVAEHGVVSAACAAAMATGVRLLCGTTYGVSTTGVAGPDRQDDQPPGTVFVGVAGPDGVRTWRLALTGDRSAVRAAAVAAALSALSEHLPPIGAGPVGEEPALG